jgi:hypothetical protein
MEFLCADTCTPGVPIFLKYDVLSEYLTPFWFAMLLNEYEIAFMIRKIRNIRNLGNVYIRCPHIVMSRTDAQNGLDFHIKDAVKSVLRFSSAHNKGRHAYINIAQILHPSNLFVLKRRVYIHLQA